MVALRSEQVLGVHHWNDRLFSFRTTRSPQFRFASGQFVMLGIDVGSRPLLRAYSIASPHYDDVLEFFSVKVPDGPLTSRLQNIAAGDDLLVSDKPVGTLVLSDLNPGRRLYLLATGTGLAPFLSIIRDPETYERFETVVLCHGVRWRRDLAYADYIRDALPQHELLGSEIRDRLLYYPCVTREAFPSRGRLTTLIESGEMARTLGLPALDPAEDRAMICGSPQMLADLSALLDRRGFAISPGSGEPGDYVIERSFVER